MELKKIISELYRIYKIIWWMCRLSFRNFCGSCTRMSIITTFKIGYILETNRFWKTKKILNFIRKKKNYDKSSI